MFGGVIGWLSFLELKTIERSMLTEGIIRLVLEEAHRIILNEFYKFVKVIDSERSLLGL